MENIVQSFDSNINNVLQNYIRKPTIIRGIVHLLLMLYVVRLAPTPPKQVLQLFENVYFKLFIFSLVLWTAQFSPSTSLLIALAFMVTVNYANTGKVWEFMDNVGSVATAPVAGPAQAIGAVKILADAAASPEASSPAVIAPIAQIAASAVTTQDGIDAVKALAQQAITPAPGTVDNVAAAASTAINSIVPGASQVTPTMVELVSPEKAIAAVDALAKAAASQIAVPAADVTPVANIAVAAMDTPEGVAAIQALAQQAITPYPGTVEKVAAAVQVAVAAIPAAQTVIPSAQAASGCYPMRNYDMSLVKPQLDGQFSFEDYQTFVGTAQ